MHRAKQRRLLSHVAKLLQATDGEADCILRTARDGDSLQTGLAMIVLSVLIDTDCSYSIRSIEFGFSNLVQGCFFPSLSSILPFLEPAASGQSAPWMISVAQHFDDYVALFYHGAVNHFTGPSEGKRRVTLISSSGMVLQQVDMTCPLAGPVSQKGYFRFGLLPYTKAYALELQVAVHKDLPLFFFRGSGLIL